MVIIKIIILYVNILYKSDTMMISPQQVPGWYMCMIVYTGVLFRFPFR